MIACESVSPHPWHNQAECNLELGHEGLHWQKWWYGGGYFWTEEEARHARKLRVRIGRWLSRG